MKHATRTGLTRFSLLLALVLMGVPAFASISVEGRVEAGNAPIAGADVSLWLATPGAPRTLATAKTTDDGSFALSMADQAGKDGVLYLVAALPLIPIQRPG